VPDTLLATMWFQLYQILSGHKKLKRCLVCQQLMDVTDCRRSKRKHDHCSKRERMRKYEEKRQWRQRAKLIDPGGSNN
jgi:hypothetical protein